MELDSVWITDFGWHKDYFYIETCLIRWMLLLVLGWEKAGQNKQSRRSREKRVCILLILHLMILFTLSLQEECFLFRTLLLSFSSSQYNRETIAKDWHQSTRDCERKRSGQREERGWDGHKRDTRLKKRRQDYPAKTQLLFSLSTRVKEKVDSTRSTRVQEWIRLINSESSLFFVMIQRQAKKKTHSHCSLTGLPILVSCPK